MFIKINSLTNKNDIDENNINVSEEPTISEDDQVKSGLTVELNLPKSKFSKALRSVLRKSNLLLFISALGILGMVFVETYFLYLMRDITDSAFEGKVADIVDKLDISLLLLIAVVVFTVINTVCKVFFLRFSINNLKNAAIKKIMQLDSQLVTKKEAEYISLLTNNTLQAEKNYFKTRYDIVYGITHVLAGIFLALTLDFRILIAAGVIFLTIYILINGLLSRLEKQAEALFTAMERYTAKVKEFIHGFRLISSSNLIPHAKTEIYREIENVQESSAQLNKKVVKINIVSQMAASCVIFALFGYTVFAVSKGLMNMGDIIFIISGLLFLLEPGLQILQCFSSLKEGGAALQGIDRDIFSLQNPVREKQCESENATIFGKDVSVCFDEHMILEHADFTLENGKKYLLTGPSGSGKSTLLKLLLGEVTPTTGQLIFGETDLSDINRDNLLENIAYMPQQSIIFDDTLKNNICMYRDITQEEYETVIKKAQLADFIEGLPKKSQHVLKNLGNQISGGEKARIALARTLLSDAKIILLDEPFANLDMENIKKIEEILLSIENKCIVIVSHIINQENLNRYDAVWHIENGKVVN